MCDSLPKKCFLIFFGRNRFLSYLREFLAIVRMSVFAPIGGVTYLKITIFLDQIDCFFNSVLFCVQFFFVGIG